MYLQQNFVARDFPAESMKLMNDNHLCIFYVWLLIYEISLPDRVINPFSFLTVIRFSYRLFCNAVENILYLVNPLT